jgi:hypothetical protein
MFVVNNLVLNKKNFPDPETSKEGPGLYSWYQKKLKEIKDSEDEWFTISSMMKTKYFKTDTGRKLKVQRFKSIPMISTFGNTDFGGESQTWAYAQSASSVKTNNGITEVVGVKQKVIGPEEKFHKIRDVELIFFLIHCSNSMRNRHIALKDEREENKTTANKNAIAAESMNLIYSDTSPISEKVTGSNNYLKQLAVSFGVVNVKNSYTTEIQNQLWNVVQNCEKDASRRGQYGFNALIKAVENMANISKRAIVLKSIDDGFLKFEEETLQWELHVAGMDPQELIHVDPAELHRSRDVITDYIISKANYLDILTGATKSPLDHVVGEKYDRSSSREEMINIAKDLGWKQAHIKKQDELVEIANYRKKPPEE